MQAKVDKAYDGFTFKATFEIIPLIFFLKNGMERKKEHFFSLRNWLKCETWEDLRPFVP